MSHASGVYPPDTEGRSIHDHFRLARGLELWEFPESGQADGVADRANSSHWFPQNRQVSAVTGRHFPRRSLPVSSESRQQDVHLGSENLSPESSFRLRLTAESLRAGLALMAVGLFAWTSRNGPPSLSVGLSVLAVTASWLLAAGVVWLGGRCPLVAWQDCLAPAGISIILAGKGPAGFAVGLGFVVLGMTTVILASALRQHERLVSTVSPRIETLALSPQPTPPPQTESPRKEIIEPVVASPTAQQQEDIAREAPVQPVVLIDEPIAESWTRREHDGEVSIEAVVHARFAAGARQTTVHLPFIPPLPALPTIETEPLDSGSEIDTKIESAYRHGARLSITRSTTGPAEEVPLGVVIYTSADEEVESL